MHEPRDCHTQLNKSEKKKYCMTSVICGILKEMLQMNLQNRNILTDLENELRFVKGTDKGEV